MTGTKVFLRCGLRSRKTGRTTTGLCEASVTNNRGQPCAESRCSLLMYCIDAHIARDQLSGGNIYAEYGRLTLTAKGARQMKSSVQGLLQPFTPLLISWAGKGELMALTQVEAHGALRRLLGDALFAGFYLNELIMALLEKWDAHPPLFSAYDGA